MVWKKKIFIEDFKVGDTLQPELETYTSVSSKAAKRIQRVGARVYTNVS